MTKKEMLNIQIKSQHDNKQKNKKSASRTHKVGNEQVFLLFNIAPEISRCTLRIKLFIFTTVKRTVKHNLQKAQKEIDRGKGSTSKVLLKLVKQKAVLFNRNERSN